MYQKWERLDIRLVGNDGGNMFFVNAIGGWRKTKFPTIEDNAEMCHIAPSPTPTVPRYSESTLP